MISKRAAQPTMVMTMTIAIAMTQEAETAANPKEEDHQGPYY